MPGVPCHPPLISKPFGQFVFCSEVLFSAPLLGSSRSRAAGPDGRQSAGWVRSAPLLQAAPGGPRQVLLPLPTSPTLPRQVLAFTQHPSTPRYTRKNTARCKLDLHQAQWGVIWGSEEPEHLLFKPRFPVTTYFSFYLLEHPIYSLVKAVPPARASPVHNSRDTLPGPKACHALELFICDPGGNDDFLGVTTAEPARKVVQRVERKQHSAVTHFPDSTISRISNPTAVHLSKLPFC